MGVNNALSMVGALMVAVGRESSGGESPCV